MIAETHTAYRIAFCARTRAARMALGWTQKQMAEALGVEQDAYRKYETRSPLPHHLIEPFCEIVGLPVVFLVTGHGREPQRRTAGGNE